MHGGLDKKILSTLADEMNRCCQSFPTEYIHTRGHFANMVLWLITNAGIQVDLC